jgi:Zn-dependent protease with chaperone function
MRVIWPLPPPVERILRCEAADAGVSVRTLEVAAPVGFQRLNAWAFPLSRKALLSEPLIEAFPPPLLRAIIRHELGHLSQGWRGWLGAANTVAKWELVALAVWLYVNGHDVWAGLAICLGTIMVSRVTRPLALSAEALADRAPLRHPAEGRALAEALIEPHRPGLVPILTRWSGPHPPLREGVAYLAPDMVGRVPSAVADLAFRRALTLWFALSTGLPVSAYWLGMLASRMG